MAKVANVIDLVTPKLPPPPPRNAQNRSGLSLADAVTTSPLGSTTVADCSASQVSPPRRVSG
ncbi:hypothetical protein, partial [Mycobacterium avium]